MNKSLFMAITACAALTMTSCSSEDLTGTGTKANETAINFNTYLGRAPQSRATITDDDAIKGKDAGFGVFASYTQSIWNNEVPNFMYNQQVKYETDKWTYSPLKYWPTNGYQISFFAYAPYQKDNSNGIDFSDNTENGAPTVTVTLQAPDKMVDFVTANAMNKTKATSENGKVSFTLQHEMTRVAFAVKTDETVDANTSITINSIKLTGAETSGELYSKGTYTFPTKDGEKGKWGDFTPSTGIELTNDNILASPSNINPEAQSTLTKDHYLFLIPANGDAGLTEGKVSVTINYTITTTDENIQGSQIKMETTSQPFELPASTLAQGKAYLFTFTIGMNAIQFDAQVDKWTTENNPEINRDL